MSVQNTGSDGMLFKLGLVVLSIGVCALSMLAMRQARLQAAHEVTQTQLRIQRADEQLWKMRADIAGLSNPVRIRELTANLGPMHALINPVEASLNPSFNVAIPMVETLVPLTLPAKSEAVSTKATGTKPADGKNAGKPTEKAGDKPGPKKPVKSQVKPKATPRPGNVSPTGLASIPAPKVRELDR